MHLDDAYGVLDNHFLPYSAKPCVFAVMEEGEGAETKGASRQIG